MGDTPREEIRDSFDYLHCIFKSNCYAVGTVFYKTLCSYNYL